MKNNGPLPSFLSVFQFYFPEVILFIFAILFLVPVKNFFEFYIFKIYFWTDDITFTWFKIHEEPRGI